MNLLLYSTIQFYTIIQSFFIYEFSPMMLINGVADAHQCYNVNQILGTVVQKLFLHMIEH